MEKLKKIDVGGYEYEIEYKNEAFVNANAQAIDGQCIFSDQKIIIAKTGNEQYQKTVLLHEICHAIIDIYISPEKQDEHFVEQFSKGLYQVLKRNPELKEII